MKLIVNGKPAEVAPDASVADVVTALGHPTSGRGVAVALNGEVVARGAWGTTPVEERDRLEVLAAVQGG
ncbi:hypothetical protein BH24ACT26_BH24ACT26_18700 [soil metagenome]